MQCLNDLDALLLDTPRVRKGDARFAADFEIKFAKTRCAIADTLRELTAERDALAAELARVRGELAAVGGLVVVAWAVVQWQEQRTRRHEATEDHTTQRLRITTQKEIAVAYIALYRDREPDARFMRLADGTAGVYLPNENELVTIDACRAELATAQTTALTRRTPPTINVPGAPQERRFLVLGDLEEW